MYKILVDEAQYIVNELPIFVYPLTKFNMSLTTILNIINQMLKESEIQVYNYHFVTSKYLQQTKCVGEKAKELDSLEFKLWNTSKAR